jgi:His-Xaa-Ser system radical SAM maturase HxsB
MIHFPLRSREVEKLGTLHANHAGQFFVAKRPIASDADDDFLFARGHAAENENTIADISHRFQVLARDTALTTMDYLILVPTLRCNLSCSYCQVSRVNIDQGGFDWSPETLKCILALIDGLTTDSVKIEFQGGEPSLRPDLIAAVIAQCDRFAEKSFVICSNLSRIEPAFKAILDRPDVTVSTSLDGDWLTHQNQRTVTEQATSMFADNLDALIAGYGSGKVSALPTIDPENLPDIDALIEAYQVRGFSSIFLRPINYQGFARKRHPASLEYDGQWWAYYNGFIERLIERNWQDKNDLLEESYFSLCLRRIFRAGLDRHVDLRNPNPVGVDYIVIDYDGTVYPTDEARMLTRSGVINLAIGDVVSGFDSDVRRTLNTHSTTHGDPACDQCVYQPFCGRDLIDDLSRYGRIDLPRQDTAFCQKHLHIFDLCMRLIYSNDAAVQYSLAKWLGLSGERLPLQARLI